MKRAKRKKIRRDQWGWVRVHRNGGFESTTSIIVYLFNPGRPANRDYSTVRFRVPNTPTRKAKA